MVAGYHGAISPGNDYAHDIRMTLSMMDTEPVPGSKVEHTVVCDTDRQAREVKRWIVRQTPPASWTLAQCQIDDKRTSSVTAVWQPAA